MRRLSPTFIDDLKTGILRALRERIAADQSLCLEIREDYLNIYYRGGNLLKVTAKGRGYTAHFDTNYTKGDAGLLPKPIAPSDINTAEDIGRWIEATARIKLAMDLYIGAHPKDEREAQQHILRDNNFGGVSSATDYFICDIEYANPQGRFDLVGVRWPSTSSSRKRQDGHRLVLVEAKFGDGALAGASGIQDHITDINHFLATGTNLQDLKDEMVELFNQKRALGLLNCGKDLVAFSDEPPMLLFVLVNHDPASSKLRTSLASLPPSPHAELYLARGCLMGYGLFDPAVLTLNDALDRWADCI